MPSGLSIRDGGILLVDKVRDWTSHDVVNFVRKRLRIKKVGHCGTLDPFATGLLVLGYGSATRLFSYMEEYQKSYLATMTFGEATDTQDLTGKVIEESDRVVTAEEIESALSEFRGELEQIPPMFSAVRHEGKKLYKLARKGQEVERASRKINVLEFTLKRFEFPVAEFEITASKGTYIRTLCHDLAHTLESCGHLSALRRTTVGPYAVEDALRIETNTTVEEIRAAALGFLHILPDLPKIAVNKAGREFVASGRALSPEELTPGALSGLKADSFVKIVDEEEDGALLAVAFYDGDLLRMKRVLVANN